MPPGTRAELLELHGGTLGIARLAASEAVHECSSHAVEGFRLLNDWGLVYCRRCGRTRNARRRAPLWALSWWRAVTWPPPHKLAATGAWKGSHGKSRGKRQSHESRCQGQQQLQTARQPVGGLNLGRPRPPCSSLLAAFMRPPKKIQRSPPPTDALTNAPSARKRLPDRCRASGRTTHCRYNRLKYGMAGRRMQKFNHALVSTLSFLCVAPRGVYEVRCFSSVLFLENRAGVRPRSPQLLNYASAAAVGCCKHWCQSFRRSAVHAT